MQTSHPNNPALAGNFAQLEQNTTDRDGRRFSSGKLCLSDCGGLLQTRPKGGLQMDQRRGWLACLLACLLARNIAGGHDFLLLMHAELEPPR